jgi:myo-inositol-1(or 4)-monophosphatase
LGVDAGGRRHRRGRSGQAALHRRSDRRHVELPPRHAALRHLDCGGDPRGAGGRPEITQALVYQPLTDESFWAEKGRGTWLNERRLRVSARRNLDDALIATGIPYCGHGNLERFQKILDAVSPNVAGIRRFGSAALDLAWVAAGRFDGFWEEDLQYWDIAAGILLVREAGGFVSDFRGSEAGLAKGQVLAANDQLHSKLHKLVGGALRA